MPKDKSDKKTKEETIEEAQEVSDVSETPEMPDISDMPEIDTTVAEPVELENMSANKEDLLDSDTLNTESIEVTPDSEIDTETVTVQPVRFASFEDSIHAQGEINKNLDILMDVKLQLTVELGRTELPIKKVLELTRGSIIELEKVAGEPVELYANGKLVAHGEVVVIEDNFGLRITSITDPDERLKGV